MVTWYKISILHESGTAQTDATKPDGGVPVGRMQSRVVDHFSLPNFWVFRPVGLVGSLVPTSVEEDSIQGAPARGTPLNPSVQAQLLGVSV